MTYLRLALLTVFHPTDFYEEVKLHSKRLSVIPSVLIFLLVIVIRYIYVLTIHLPLADIRINDTNLLLEIGRILLPVLTIILSIYAVTSILYGETSIRMIFISISYSFVPFIVMTPLIIILSRFISLSEIKLFNMVNSVMWLWIVLLIFFGIMLMNNYGFVKSVFVSILSIILTLLIWAIAIIIIALSFQIIGFFSEIMQEYLLQKL